MAGGQRRIDQMYAFTQVDPSDNTEGVIAFHTGSGWMPMVGADMERVEYLRPMAQNIANQTGTPVKLLRFSFRDEIEAIEPECITCPKCGMTSFNPSDIREGYCGNCHDWTRKGS